MQVFAQENALPLLLSDLDISNSVLHQTSDPIVNTPDTISNSLQGSGIVKAPAGSTANTQDVHKAIKQHSDLHLLLNGVEKKSGEYGWSGCDQTLEVALPTLLISFGLVVVFQL